MYAHNFHNTQSLIEYIRHIDTNDEAKLNMLKEPLFLDAGHKAYFDKTLQTFLLSIMEQSYEKSFRRGRACLRLFEEQRYKNYMRVLGIFKKAKQHLAALKSYKFI